MELKLEDIKYLKKNNEILKGIDISLFNNSIISVIGKNGSGKTSLLDIISLKEIPTQGNICYKKSIINKSSSKKSLDIFRSKVYYSFQNPYSQLLNIPSLENHTDINTIEIFNEFSPPKNYNDKISFGEIKKLQFLNAILSNKEILLLDDPVSGLDNKSISSIIKYLKKSKSKDKIIVIASNNIDFALEVSDFIIVMDSGKIVLSGNKYDVFKEENLLKSIGIMPPKITEFENYVLKEKNIRLGYRDQINDLLKDIYRNV